MSVELGAKSGVFAAIITSGVGVISSLIINSLIYGIQIPTSMYLYMTLNIFIPYIIFGLLAGVIFSVIYKYLPGQSAVVKSVIMNIVIWAIVNLYNIFFLLSKDFVGISFIMINVTQGLITSIIFGYLLGFFWMKFSREKEQEVIEF